MKFKSGKWLLLSLALLLFLLPYSSVSAQTTQNFTSNEEKTVQEPNADLKAKNHSEEKLDKILHNKLNYPVELTQKLSRTAKVDIVTNDAELASYQVKNYKQNKDGSLEEIDEDAITTFGTIPSSRLRLIVGEARLSERYGRERFLLFSEAEWNSDYYYDLTDKHAIAYSSEFEVDGYTNGDYYCRHYDVANNNTFDTCGGRPAVIDQSGAGWSVNILNGEIDGSYIRVKVQTDDSSEPGNIEYGNVVGEYAHDTSIGGGIGISIGWASISFSSGSGYDTAAAQEVGS